METEIDNRKVDIPYADEANRNKITKKGNIKRYCKGLSKVPTEPENISQSENIKESYFKCAININAKGYGWTVKVEAFTKI